VTTFGNPPEDPPTGTSLGQQQPPPPQQPGPGTLSPDGRWLWNGQTWQPATHEQVTTGGLRSPDGQWVWTASGWQPIGGPQPGANLATPPGPGYGPYSTSHLTVVPKNPAVSVVLSAIIPGVGSMVNGDVGTGVIILLGFLVSAFLWFFLIGIILTPLVWIFGMVHAYQGARKWNLRHGFLS
jgi:TM2 domain-containing membrane protein YozV